MICLTNVLVLFGGQSTEHEVSLKSATNILNKLNEKKYNVIKVGITKLGRWFLYEGDIKHIKDGSWENKNITPAFLSPDASMGLVVLKDGNADIKKVDVVFPVLHGACGEDGTIQGLCALAKIPCVGPDMISSAVCMDKTATKIMLKNLGIPQADWLTVLDYELNDIEAVVEKIEDKFCYPVFIKPANAGSSVGIGKSHNKDELKEHLKRAAEVDSKILVEEYIEGREVECAVLGNNQPVASVLGEIVPDKEFYDYEAKYQSDSKLVIPAPISETKSNQIREFAKKAFTQIGLKGMSRIDFFVHKMTGDIYLNEINTIPGFTDISMYPMLLEHTGIGTEELVDKLIELAIENFVGEV
ncbi:MAG: D-alanine--D-alanine ligase [Clostridia bacterium]|nr:D-alanine--D-alanine ligase [Clostridia bacterium]